MGKSHCGTCGKKHKKCTCIRVTREEYKVRVEDCGCGRSCRDRCHTCGFCAGRCQCRRARGCNVCGFEACRCRERCVTVISPYVPVCAPVQGYGLAGCGIGGYGLGGYGIGGYVVGGCGVGGYGFGGGCGLGGQQYVNALGLTVRYNNC